MPSCGAGATISAVVPFLHQHCKRQRSCLGKITFEKNPLNCMFLKNFKQTHFHAEQIAGFCSLGLSEVAGLHLGTLFYLLPPKVHCMTVSHIQMKEEGNRRLKAAKFSKEIL